jgi:hypothetical protein
VALDKNRDKRRNFPTKDAFIRLAMNTEEHDDLWELMGRAKAPAPSPFFSRNVLRAIREEAQEKPGFLLWLRSRWQVATASTCAAALAVTFAFMQTAPEQQPDPALLLVQQVSNSPDLQVISNLDELLDSERNSVWLEASIN